MELKVVCLCGQKYKFDVEPINLQMPFTVTCPVCGHDGTKLANALLMQLPAPPPLPIPAPTAVANAAAVPSGLRLNRTAEPPMAPPVPATVTAPSAVATALAAPPTRRPAPSTPTQARSVPKYLQDNKAIQGNNFFLGVVGAVLGAIVAVGLMVGFTELTGFRFPLLGTIMGAIIGGGARFMYKGTDSTLGFMAAGVAFVAIVGVDVMMFNLFSVLYTGIISLMVGVSFAWKIAS